MASINVASLSQRKAKEPSMYVDMKKICKRCKQSNVKFKFLNNKKQDQPRYQCQDCTLELGKPYHFNPFPIREHNHEDGYAKLPKVETEELKNFNKVCDNCQAENNATFRGYNNGKVNQPRYACNVCKQLFSPLKNSKATSTKRDLSSSEFQTIGVQYQEARASQQSNEIDVSSSEFQTTGAQYQEAIASQQPNEIDVSSSEFQTTGAQYQEAGASQQPLLCNALYEQTSISYQQYNQCNPYGQSRDNHSVPTMDVDGSSNQFLSPSQNVEAWQSQQPSLYNTSFDQASILSQQQNYHYPYNQISGNHSLASMDVDGSSNQFSSLLQTAEARQWQQSFLYNTSFDQNSISSQQHSSPHPYNQGTDNHYLASVDVDGSSNQFHGQQASLYIDPFGQQTSILFEQHSNPHPQGQSNNDDPCAPNIDSTPPSQHPPPQSNFILPLHSSDVKTNEGEFFSFDENDSEVQDLLTSFINLI